MFVTVGARYADKLAGGIRCEVDVHSKLKGALKIIYIYIASFRATMYRNRWTVCREPMPKRQSEDEFVSVYTRRRHWRMDGQARVIGRVAAV